MKITGSDIEVEYFSRYVVLRYRNIPSGKVSLDIYLRELSVGESRLNGKAMEIQSRLKGLGIRGTKRNIGIDVRVGEMGMVVEFSRVIDLRELELIGGMT